ncbi:peptidoglycan-binding domain-containing protein [Actinophytocola sp.]|uniref:peptidoglycan-binding domain-containing protein n=1 Tax=Actinophytocola sp. TaxID=1872138 RepID=UPI002ED23815
MTLNRRAFVLGTGAVAVVGGAGAAAAFGFGGTAEPAPRSSTLPPATAKATRTTLTATEKVSGTLGYGTATTLTGHGKGTLTWLPAPGTVVGRGQPIYSVDLQPVAVLHGTIPPYRALAPGVTGEDVRQLEENLTALGYGGFTVDDEYTEATADAVAAWQSDLSRADTGVVEPADVVVFAGDVRVASILAVPGDPAGAPLLTHTGVTRAVTVDLDVAKQHLVRVGIEATITLPDGKTVAGTVTSVGTVASAPPAANNGPQEPATIEVVVSVADQTALGALDSAPVDVTLVSERRENVVAVPVGALVALAEGGYGVQVVDGGRTSYVAVETGLFADGLVEVTGVGEGTVVGVPT